MQNQDIYKFILKRGPKIACSPLTCWCTDHNTTIQQPNTSYKFRKQKIQLSLVPPSPRFARLRPHLIHNTKYNNTNPIYTSSEKIFKNGLVPSSPEHSVACLRPHLIHNTKYNHTTTPYVQVQKKGSKIAWILLNIRWQA